MTEYTEEDFANAQFAQHPDGRIAARLAIYPEFQWTTRGNEYADEGMRLNGWVPVPTKPTITESQRAENQAEWGIPESGAWLRGFYYAGGEVVPDPEPTNTEKLSNDLANGLHMLNSHMSPNPGKPFHASKSESEQLAEYLTECGWVKEK